MAFLTKLPVQNTSSGYRAISPKSFSFKIRVVVFALALTLGIGIYLQFAPETSKQPKPAVAMARNGTVEEKQRLAFLEEKLKNRITLSYRERREFAELLWIVKGIRLFDCDKNGQNYIKELGILTEFKMSEDDLDWRGTGKTLDDALKEAFRRTKLPMEDFEVTKWSKDMYGKSRPVEWRTKHNSEVNIDPPHIYDGPDVFHVGYKTEGKKNILGHILMDCLPYFRDIKKDDG